MARPCREINWIHSPHSRPRSLACLAQCPNNRPLSQRVGDPAKSESYECICKFPTIKFPSNAPETSEADSGKHNSVVTTQVLQVRVTSWTAILLIVRTNQLKPKVSCIFLTECALNRQP